MSVRRCLLVLSALAWCSVLAASRRVHSGERWSLHLVFNTALAAAPLVLSGLAVRLLRERDGEPHDRLAGLGLRGAGRRLGARRLLGWALLPVWLVVFPNAPYLFSELAHLHPRSGAPFTFDLVLLCSVAGVGLLFTLLSLDDMHRLLSRRFGEVATWALLTPALFASGFALSLGRELRWNSWDVLRHPRALLFDVLGHAWEPRAMAYTVGFGVLLTLTHALGRELGRSADAARR